MEKLYDVLISHFKKESKPLDLFKDTPNDLVSTRHITDKLDVYNLVMSYDLKTEFPIFHSMCSKLNELDLTRGDILYITYVTFAYPLKVTVVRTYKDRVIVRRDA